MSKFKKTIAGVVGFAVALSLSVVVSTPAKAATVAELTALIASLQAQIAALSGGSTTASATFSRDLTIGSSGADVTALQNWLIGKGYSIPAGATGYFGAQTQAAVKAYQMAKGITPAAGYFGPTTRGYVNGEAGSSAGGSTSTGTSSSLEGTDGTISDVDTLSGYSSEEVGEGEEDVKIAGFEVEASNDGDIALRSVKLTFDQTGNASGDSDHLDDYVSGVKVWMGDKEIGSADVDDFNEESDDTYSKTITLKNAVIASDDTEKFYISVDAAGSFDSSDIDSDSWTVAVESIRYEDGSGVVSTDSTTGDLGDTGTTIGTNGTAGDGVPVNFVSFSSAADTELKFSKASDSPKSGTVTVDSSDMTEDVSLLKGKIKLEGTSDVVLDELPVTFTVTGATEVDQVTGSVKLVIDGEDYSETVTTSSSATTVTFDNLDLTIDAGSTITFEVLADIEDTDGDLDDGDTIKAEVTATNLDYVDAENEEGDQLADDTEKTGTSLGEELELREEGIKVSLKSVSASVDADGTNTYNDTGTFTITYLVEAFGDTAYLSDTATATTSTSIPDTSLSSGGNRFLLDIGGTATTSAISTGVTYSKGDGAEDSANGNIQLEDGESSEVSVTVSRTNTAVYANGGLMKVLLKAILWNTDDDASTFSVYDFDLDDYDSSNTAEGGKLIAVN